MKTGREVMAEYGIPEDQQRVEASEFAKAGLPMIVACYGCDMTLCIANCLLDDDGRFWCKSCAEDLESV
jgi:hypothetical protein